MPILYMPYKINKVCPNPININIDFGPNIVIKLPDRNGLTIAPNAKVKIREEFNSIISSETQKSLAWAALNENMGKVAPPNKNIRK